MLKHKFMGRVAFTKLQKWKFKSLFWKVIDKNNGWNAKVLGNADNFGVWLSLYLGTISEVFYYTQLFFRPKIPNIFPGALNHERILIWDTYLGFDKHLDSLILMT